MRRTNTSPFYLYRLLKSVSVLFTGLALCVRLCIRKWRAGDLGTPTPKVFYPFPLEQQHFLSSFHGKYQFFVSNRFSPISSMFSRVPKIFARPTLILAAHQHSRIQLKRRVRSTDGVTTVTRELR